MLLKAEKKFLIPFQEEKPSRSWLIAPLTVHEKTIGAISAQSFQPNIFSENDLHIMESLGSQIAIAIENTRRDLYVLTTAMRRAGLLQDEAAEELH